MRLKRTIDRAELKKSSLENLRRLARFLGVEIPEHCPKNRAIRQIEAALDKEALTPASQ